MTGTQIMRIEWIQRIYIRVRLGGQDGVAGCLERNRGLSQKSRMMTGNADHTDVTDERGNNDEWS